VQVEKEGLVGDIWQRLQGRRRIEFLLRRSSSVNATVGVNLAVKKRVWCVYGRVDRSKRLRRRGLLIALCFSGNLKIFVLHNQIGAELRSLVPIGL